MTEANRIRLAEAMGWKQEIHQPFANAKGMPYWRRGDETCSHIDPFTDANDCEALIKWLWTEHKVEVEISFGEFHSVSWMDGEVWPAPESFGIDWKQGVCELALKVIE